jgi:hypothetical protein
MKQGTRGLRGLTERDRFWLRHVRACTRSGEAATEYTKRHGLAVGAYYEAKRRLIGRGALSRAGTTSRPPSVFTQVVAADPGRDRSGGFRIRLPGGALLEWERVPEAATIESLIGRLEG